VPAHDHQHLLTELIMAQVIPVQHLESSTPPETMTFSSGLPFAPTPTGSTGRPGIGGNISTSSSMYLYTFLATLLILLGVSSAIVLRSIVLRRRQRHMIETAIADGTWMPPRTRQRRAGRSKNLGEKPKMFVAAFGKDESDGDVDGVGKEKVRDEKFENVQWKDVLPVSASYVTPSITTPPMIPIIPRISPSQPPPSSTIHSSSEPKHHWITLNCYEYRSSLPCHHDFLLVRIKKTYHLWRSV